MKTFSPHIIHHHHEEYYRHKLDWKWEKYTHTVTRIDCFRELTKWLLVMNQATYTLVGQGLALIVNLVIHFYFYFLSCSLLEMNWRTTKALGWEFHDIVIAKLDCLLANLVFYAYVEFKIWPVSYNNSLTII